MKKRKIGITGYHGFIGSNLFSLFENEKYEVIGWDIKKDTDLFKLQDLFGVDTIIHLAALTNVNDSFKNVSEYFYTNVVGTTHMIELCRQFGATLIYPSSAAVDEPETSPYACSKMFAQEIIAHMADIVPSVILKLYNVYGRQAAKGSLFYNFLHGDKLVIHGDGKQERDFINVKDVCNIIKLVVDEKWQDIEMNVGTGKTTSVNEIAKIFQKYTGKEIVYEKNTFSGIKKSKAEIIRNDELLPFNLSTNLDKDIKEMVLSFN